MDDAFDGEIDWPGLLKPHVLETRDSVWELIGVTPPKGRLLGSGDPPIKPVQQVEVFIHHWRYYAHQRAIEHMHKVADFADHASDLRGIWQDARMSDAVEPEAGQGFPLRVRPSDRAACLNDRDPFLNHKLPLSDLLVEPVACKR